MNMPRFFFLAALSSTLTFFLPAPTQADDYTFFIRQVQLPDDLIWDADVEQQGSQESELPINPNGARFELWTVKADPLTDYLLDTTYVNSYIPVSEVKITSEDPYEVIPRTRCDRPFTVEITTNGLTSDPTAPAAAQSVRLLQHLQVYQGDDNGKDVDRSAATLVTPTGSIDSNGVTTLSYGLSTLPGTNREKIKGEQRFSIFSLADYQAPESQLDSLFIQIWPLADSTISGLAANDTVKGRAPEVSIELNDLYPDSWTYAQVYQGSPQLNTDGTLVPGSSILVDSSVPRDEVLIIDDLDSVLPNDGLWTIEVLTATPFGVDRLTYFSFNVDRKITVNGAVTSVE